MTGYKVQPGNLSALAKTLVCLIGDGKKRRSWQAMGGNWSSAITGGMI